MIMKSCVADNRFIQIPQLSFGFKITYSRTEVLNIKFFVLLVRDDNRLMRIQNAHQTINFPIDPPEANECYCL